MCNAPWARRALLYVASLASFAAALYFPEAIFGATVKSLLRNGDIVLYFVTKYAVLAFVCCPFACIGALLLAKARHYRKRS